MPWEKTPADRERDRQIYQDPEYVRNRAVCKRNANGRCAQCQHRHTRLQCDHITAVTQGGTHALENLRMVCAGPGSCRCHERKTAGEGGGYRAKPRPDPPAQPRTRW
jgi:hypothetical protein